MPKAMVPLLDSAMVERSPKEPARASTNTASSQAVEGSKAGAGYPLNFRVTEAFRREFRIYAATKGLRLNEVLVLAFRALSESDSVSN